MYLDIMYLVYISRCVTKKSYVSRKSQYGLQFEMKGDASILAKPFTRFL
jgi:hypothetical protein